METTEARRSGDLGRAENSASVMDVGSALDELLLAAATTAVAAVSKMQPFFFRCCALYLFGEGFSDEERKLGGEENEVPSPLPPLTLIHHVL